MVTASRKGQLRAPSPLLAAFESVAFPSERTQDSAQAGTYEFASDWHCPSLWLPAITQVGLQERPGRRLSRACGCQDDSDCRMYRHGEVLCCG